ncbi:WD repeat-containing protein 44 isoform X2 [Exaiptasia diaphana]|uniref:WD repeat-containing protein 44 n=1 Tax=Exaiptasia diaphana TaxID=2652724 RepID=A0A913XGF5_EXADI|nr:WD repeat-containing protein 44 isoform X2 [Exaiptasia diaphana]
MQSDSDSEGEFFDASESQNNSFDATSSKLITKLGHKNDGKNSEHCHDKEIRNKENKILSQKKPTTESIKDITKDSNQLQTHTIENKQENNESSIPESLTLNPPVIETNNIDRQCTKVNKLELDLQEETHKKDIVDVVKTRSSSTPLSPVSEVLKSVETGGVGLLDKGDGGEAESPAPVAPPRRKRKKKPEAKAAIVKSVEDLKDSASMDKPDPTPDSSQTSPNQTVPLKVCGGASEKTSIPAELGVPEQDELGVSEQEDDPAITLDYKSTEMKQVLEKASSTEVIPAFSLDARRKSNSVTSLGSSTSVTSTNAIQHPPGNYGSLVRVRSESGRPLSDAEILEQVIVKNLDTGESIPLSLAEDRLPKGTNPLALHIMRLTSEYSSSNSKLNTIDQEDGIDVGNKVKKKTKKLKSFLGRTVNKMKSDKKVKEVQRGDESSSSDDDESPSSPFIKIKSAHGKGPEEFEKLKLLQDLSGEHVGAIWTVKFSVCGRLMATAGQDHMVRVWVLKENEEYFEEMRKKYSKTGGQSTNPDPEVDQILEHDEQEEYSSEDEAEKSEEGKEELDDGAKKVVEEDNGPFKRKPFCTYYGHTGDVLDLSWSKNYFLLSSSMDKTVRLWHISRTECLCCFQHIDFVTAIVFHPRDDRYFLSGSLDGKIRLWNIPDKKVALWNEVEGTGSNLITAANFCLQGRFAVVGTYDGRCIFYETERLKYHTQWQVSPTRNKRSRGRKISGIEPMPGEEKVLVTSNDSRIRLYDLKDNSLSCKYKGCTNSSSQIKASFSHDGQYLICGSEDHFAYIWRTQHGIPSARRDKNEFYESFSAHTAVVTVATFTPVPWLIVAPDTSGKPVTSEVLVTADWTGAIKLFVNR